ncbi:hypothetical protein XENTR_v10005358 [Xenopus tropicalis]|nr:hypothetical protein XENTR_v10005358 [Xenopus tropicalis]
MELLNFYTGQDLAEICWLRWATQLATSGLHPTYASFFVLQIVHTILPNQLYLTVLIIFSSSSCYCRIAQDNVCCCNYS